MRHDILRTAKKCARLIIAISETRLNKNSSVILHIPGYLFVRTDSKSHAGGVGLYISDQQVFSTTRDLDISRDGIKSCWIEIIRKRQKNVLIGSVHRRPKGNLEVFRENLRKPPEQLNNEGHKVLVLRTLKLISSPYCAL